MPPPKLILASASPRRRELLAHLGVEFCARDACIDERALPGESPADMSVRLACEKARHAFAQYGGAVLAGDTVVALGGRAFGKPADRGEAAEMLRALSGRAHTVFSAAALVTPGKTTHTVSATEITFRQLTRAQIETYCAGGEPLGKAGAYAIQGGGAQFVKHLHGSYSGVVGLPLWHVWQLLRGGGWEL